MENGRHYNLYTSCLYLLSSKYNTLLTYEQKYELVDQMIRYVIREICDIYGGYGAMGVNVRSINTSLKLKMPTFNRDRLPAIWH